MRTAILVIKRMLADKSSGFFNFYAIVAAVILAPLLVSLLVRPDPPIQDTAKKIMMTKGLLRGLGTALDVFRQQSGRYPTAEEGLVALLRKPPSLSDDAWDGPYLVEVPVDPWNTQMVYRSRRDVRRTFEIRSAGPDKKVDTLDDITASQSGLMEER